MLRTTSKRVTAIGLVLCGLVCFAGAGLAQDQALLDGTLESLRGGTRSFADERGHRVVVLFYEDRPHIDDNAQFKQELSRFWTDNRLSDRMVVYGVANLGDVGSYPRPLVRAMIGPLADRWGVEILLDWDGALRRPPISLHTHATNTVIADREGRIVWWHVGEIDATKRTEFYRVLRAQLAASRQASAQTSAAN
jgi:hypothetical protein